MSRHLSSDQISLLLIEDNAAARAHIESCPVCCREFERTEEALSHFRLSAHHWASEAKAVPTAHSAPGMRVLAALSLCICLVAGARVICLRSPANPPGVSTAVSDAELLESVTHQVSQAYASPLQPLAIVAE